MTGPVTLEPNRSLALVPDPRSGPQSVVPGAGPWSLGSWSLVPGFVVLVRSLWLLVLVTTPLSQSAVPMSWSLTPGPSEPEALSIAPGAKARCTRVAPGALGWPLGQNGFAWGKEGFILWKEVAPGANWLPLGQRVAPLDPQDRGQGPRPRD